MGFCIMAGVTDYVVLVEEGKVLYFGSRGESYVEMFPEAGELSDWEPDRCKYVGLRFDNY